MESNKSEKPSRYRVFVLRAWEVQETTADSSVIWRYRIQDINTAESQHFANTDDLIDFLRDEFADGEDDERQPDQAP